MNVAVTPPVVVIAFDPVTSAIHIRAPEWLIPEITLFPAESVAVMLRMSTVMGRLATDPL